MEEQAKSQRDWKYYLGISLFIFSFIPYTIAFIVPFMGFPALKVATIMTTLIVFSEIVFLVSIVLLGRAFWVMFKDRFSWKNLSEMFK